jgi:hypothetical protein
MVVHDGLHPGVAEGAAVLDDRLDHLAKGEHADQFAMVHDDERADVLLGHDIERRAQGFAGRDRKERAALDAQDVADLHGCLLAVCDSI